jgi:hypothetical protein
MKKLKKLTKDKLKNGQVVYESHGYFFLDNIGNGYKLIKPLKTSELLSFIPGCEETDEKEKNCNVYVMQKWLVEDLSNGKKLNKLIVAYLAKWDTAYIKYNHIVSIDDIFDNNIIE